MRHNKSGRKLGRNSTHKRAMMRNMATSLFRYGSIQTTLPKAKEIRPYAEKLITRAIEASLADIRIILSKLTDRSVAHHLINEIAPNFKDRKGGYLRIIKLGQRKGDGAEMAIIELISDAAADKKDSKRRKKTKKESPAKGEDKSKKQDSSAKGEPDLHDDHEKTHPREEQTKEHLTPGSKAEGTRKSSKPPKRSVPKQSSVNRGTSTPKTPPPSSQDK